MVTLALPITLSLRMELASKFGVVTPLILRTRLARQSQLKTRVSTSIRLRHTPAMKVRTAVLKTTG